MTNDDQRPDLDAAIDAVIPSLTAVDDDTATASLRRTRIALADTAPRRTGIATWRWAAPVALVATVLVAVSLWWPRTHVIDTPRVAVNRTAPAPAPAVLPAARPSVSPIVVPPRVIRSERPAPTALVEARTARRADGTPRPDPLVALVQAVQEIPETAWARTVTHADAPLAVSDVPVASIDVTPLDTPALPGTVNEPIAPGEP